MKFKVLALLGLIAFVVVIAGGIAQAGSVQVESIAGQTLSDVVGQKLHSSWPWYLVRASGFVAAISLVILMVGGIGHITGFTYRFLEPLTAWATHRALGLVFGVSVLIHMLGLLFDHFAPFTILQLFVPWLSHYRPVTLFGVQLGSLWVALGVLAFYGTAAVVVTSLVWVEKKPKVWKFIHLASYAILILVFVHALYLGTDLAAGLVRWLWLIGAVVLACLTLSRLWRAGTV